ncbi:MAG TPA: DUF1573 domain-containing protein [Cyclobacteriaceae bacterium]|nr:DUF1573 domain-containing protein [Cyclobacteriaceae bacterium]
MKIRLSVLLIILLIFGNLRAQDQVAILTFESTTHDFGTVEEANGPVSHTFKFTNTGSSPLVIQGVQASCGCTTPDWTRDPVMPGKTGIIKAEYNPRNRPGMFNKSLTVTANTNPATTRLFIKGNVNPRPHTLVDDYPVQMGGIRTRYRSFNFGKITTEKKLVQQFDVYNDSDKAIQFLDKIEAPEFISASVTPQSLAPKTTGKIVVSLDPTMKKELGFVTYNLKLFTDEPENSLKDFRIMATIQEYFPPMNAEELALAPRLAFDKMSFDFGSIKQSEKVSTEFIMTNNGKSDLNIRQTSSNCGCVVAEMEKTILKPGESVPIKVTFDPAGRRGIQQKSISIFSNDPTGPTQMITIKANVSTATGS